MDIPKIVFFLSPLQLGAKFLVTSQLTISILGVLRRHCIPLAADPHTGTGVNIRNGNDNKRSNSNRKVGRPELTQSFTYLRLTQDRHMQGTMKNLTLVARYARCAITKSMCLRSCLGLVYIRATSQCIVGVRGVEADLQQLRYKVACAISCINHNLSCGTCNMPLTTRPDKAQYNVKRHAGWQPTPSICRLKVEYRGAIANAMAPKASKIFAHFFRLLWLNPFSLGNQIHNS